MRGTAAAHDTAPGASGVTYVVANHVVVDHLLSVMFGRASGDRVCLFYGGHEFERYYSVLIKPPVVNPFATDPRVFG